MQTFFMDGTFRTVTVIFKHLFIIHGRKTCHNFDFCVIIE